jgi:HK97 family phage major capsid protein
MEKTVINFGQAVKALPDGKIGGYLVTFGGLDLTGDYFTAETDFGEYARLPVLYHHGMDKKLSTRRIGTAEVRMEDAGLWAEAQLEMRDEYERMVYELAQNGKLGWSSGAASHVVQKALDDQGARITQWYMAEASLTPAPAEPRNTVIPLKSLLGDNTATQTATDEAEAGQPAQSASGADAESIIDPTKEQDKMELDETKLQELMAGAAAEAVKAYREAEPPLKTAAANIEVVKDEADRPFKSIAEQCIAIKAFELSHGRREDSRLKRLDLKGVATGANENVQTEGGYLLDPTLSTTLMKPIHEEGPFTNQVTRLPVSNNSNYGWINGVDETSRADGSRWGGIRGYWAAEAATVTASKPAFRRINWELNKLFILAYGTDELLADAAQFEAVLQQGAREEMAFKVNNGVLNGTGAGQPLGVLNSGALISITAETGQAAATVLYENLIKMWARLPSASKPKANWYINTDVNPQLDQLSLASGTAALEPRFIGYDQNGVMRIKGRPVIETEFNATLGTVGDIVLMDPTAYLMWEKTGVEAATSIHVQFIYDETTFRFTYRCDGQPSISTYITPFMGTNYLSPFIALATRS